MFYHILIIASQSGEISVVISQTMIKLQKRAARIILHKGIDTPSADIFVELTWMKFPDRATYQKSVLMYKIFNNLTPAYLQEFCTFTSDIHQRSRASINFQNQEVQDFQSSKSGSLTKETWRK